MSFSRSSLPKVLTNVRDLDKYLLDVMFLENITARDITEHKPQLTILNKDSERDQLRRIPTMSGVQHRIISNQDYIKNILKEAVEADLVQTDVVSVFTSTFNTKPERIKGLISSLTKQTYEHWELVIVDDTVSDNVYNQLLEHAKYDARIKVHKFRESSGGCIGEAKYRAAMMTTGKYLVELDHDDELTINALDTIVKAFKSYPDHGFIYSNCAEIKLNDDGTKDSMRYPDGFAFGFSGYEEYTLGDEQVLGAIAPTLNAQTIRHIVSVPNHVRCWRRDVYLKIGGHNRNLRIADDYELIVRTFLETKWLHINDLLYIQNFDGANSQDAGSARACIQKMVEHIAEHYSKRITLRLLELGCIDPFEHTPVTELWKQNHTNSNLTKLNDTI